MTTGQTDRLTGILALLEMDGRLVTADTGESFMALIQDQPWYEDPINVARQKTPMKVSITALSLQAIQLGGISASAPNDPRAIKTLSESDYGNITISSYDETRGDALTWKWSGEAQRQN